MHTVHWRGLRQWGRSHDALEKHHKPCVDSHPVWHSCPNVKEAGFFRFYFSIQSQKCTITPARAGGWLEGVDVGRADDVSGPGHRYGRHRVGLGEGQPLWAVGSIQRTTYLLPLHSCPSTASLGVSRRSATRRNDRIGRASSKSNSAFLSSFIFTVY